MQFSPKSTTINVKVIRQMGGITIFSICKITLNNNQIMAYSVQFHLTNLGWSVVKYFNTEQHLL
jgi:hypothetical protein